MKKKRSSQLADREGGELPEACDCPLLRRDVSELPDRERAELEHRECPMLRREGAALPQREGTELPVCEGAELEDCELGPMLCLR